MTTSTGKTPQQIRRRRFIISVIIVSVFVHVLIGGMAAIWVVARYFKQMPAEFEVRRDIRLPAQEREHRMNMAEFDAMAPKPSFSEKLVSLQPTEFALPDLPKVPLNQTIPLDPSEIVSDQVASMVGTSGLGSAGFGKSGSGGTGTGMSFFGIKDDGRSVVIMIDVSDSMFTRTGDAEGRKKVKKGKEQSFQAVRDEAIKLVQNLSINSRFGIIKWSGGAYTWKPELVPATDANKNAAIEYIQSEVDMHRAPPKDGRPGGTRHDYALEEAFKLQPEVIFMLTDGNATAAQKGGGLKTIEPRDIWKVASEGQKSLPQEARLHVIYYLTGADKDEERRMLKSLASRNKGQFREVEAPGRKK